MKVKDGIKYERLVKMSSSFHRLLNAFSKILKRLNNLFRKCSPHTLDKSALIFLTILVCLLFINTFGFIIVIIIVSITKFSIVIGSPWAYLSRNRRVIAWVSNFNFLLLDTYVIRPSITRALMASFVMLPTGFKTYGKRY